MDAFGISTRMRSRISRMVAQLLRALTRFPAWLDAGPRPDARRELRGLLLKRRLWLHRSHMVVPTTLVEPTCGIMDPRMADVEQVQAPVESLEGHLFTPYRGGFS